MSIFCLLCLDQLAPSGKGDASQRLDDVAWVGGTCCRRSTDFLPIFGNLIDHARARRRSEKGTMALLTLDVLGVWRMLWAVERTEQM